MKKRKLTQTLREKLQKKINEGKLTPEQKERAIDTLNQLNAIKIEEKPPCQHETLKKIVDKDVWYQCANKNCKIILQLPLEIGYTKDMLLKIIREVKKKAK